jgi:hypothetical protein
MEKRNRQKNKTRKKMYLKSSAFYLPVSKESGPRGPGFDIAPGMGCFT